MIGPCHSCRFWKFANTVHPGWGHCYAAQEQTEKQYYDQSPDAEHRPKRGAGKASAGFVAIGSNSVSGILATRKTFKCNEYEPK